MKPARYLPSSAAPTTAFERDLDKSLNAMFADFYHMLAGGLLFSDNFDGHTVTFTTDATPGVETAIEHGLKRVPTGFLILEKNKAAHIFGGSTDKTSTHYYIQSDAESVTVTLMFF